MNDSDTPTPTPPATGDPAIPPGTPARERWLYANPAAYAQVMQGLAEAKEGTIVTLEPKTVARMRALADSTD